MDKYQNLFRDVRFLMLPILLFGLFCFYWQQQNKTSGIALQSTNFNVLTIAEYGKRPLLSFTFEVTYKGEKPKWWGKTSSNIRPKNFTLFDREGHSVQPITFIYNKRKKGGLYETPQGYEPGKDVYYANVSMFIANDTPVNSGNVKVTLQAIDSYPTPKNIYAETTIEMIAKVDCNYDGC